MRLYISADMEGTAAVCSWAQVDPSNQHDYPVSRRYMNREIRAAIDGARTVAPCEVLINDSHWDMRNILWDELPSDVRAITGSRKPHSMAQGAEERFDAAFFTGYHGAIGARNAVLAHTYSNETIYAVRINGRACSEALLNAAFLGYYGTPVILITGDRDIVESTLVDLPWATGVIVKDAIGYFSANSLTPQAACEAITRGAAEAMRQIARAKPFLFAPPISLEIDTFGAEHADFIELLPGFQRISGRTVSFATDHYPSAFRAFLAAMRIAVKANLPA